MTGSAPSRRPHPEEHREAMRLEGWMQHMDSRPSFETLAEFIIGPRFARTRWQAPQDEGLRKPQFNLRSRSRAAYRDGAWGDLPDGLHGDLCVQPLTKKYSDFPNTQITTISIAIPSHMRGVSRSSRTLGAGCDGRGSDARRAALLRTAKSCGPDAPTLASSFVERSAQATVTNKPGHRGEHEGNR
jgi:hypothetical protein